MTTVSVVPLDEVGTTLLAAASRLLAEHGPAALTVRRIAAEAGMSTMNVYSRFGGKDGVVEHLFLRGFELLAAGLEAVPHTDDPMADLVRCGDEYRRFALEHTTLYSVMFDRVVPLFEASESASIKAAATLQELADRLHLAMLAGSLRPADPLHTAAIVWSTCHGVVSLELKKSGLPIDWDAVYRDACAAIIKGLAV